LVWQGFECSPFDHGESWVTNQAGNSVDASYSGVALAGTKSLRITGTAAISGMLISPDFGSRTEVYVYFLFRPVSLPSGLKAFFQLADDANGVIVRWNASLQTNGTVQISSSTIDSTVGAMTAGTTYGVWIHYNSVGPVYTLGFSSTGIRPIAGANFVTASGAQTQNARSMILGYHSGILDYEFLWDNVLVSTTLIGDNPP
jgi:hypothetical protein